MRRSERETKSIWHDIYVPPFPFLQKNITADVCVVGAGIAGLTTGYFLQKEGLSVVVVDAWGLASGETGRTTAHLTAVLDDGFIKIEKLFGRENARLAADSHRAAIDKIEEIVKAENIDCDFERLNAYLTALTPEQQKNLVKEAEACKNAGFDDQEFLFEIGIPFISVGPSVRFPQQATFNISKYMVGLAKAFQNAGGRIYTNTRITEVHGGNKPYAETDEGKRIQAKSIVLATNTPFNDRVTMHTKQAAYRTYVVAFQVPKGTYPPFLLWDMHEPYHYARIVHGVTNDFLIVGGEDHKTGQANDAENRYRRVEEWARMRFTIAGTIVYRWSGQIMEPVDALAFIGRNPGDKNVYIITGDSGNGITHGTIAGMLLGDLIQGRENPWEHLYDPARKNLKSVPTYIKENTNFVGCMISDWAAPAEVTSLNEIKAGTAAIMRKGISKVAVYKDEEGQTHQCSAVCTHLGCVVQWNGGEKSWDCPCHGSRFDTEGRILNGPAAKPLEEFFETEKEQRFSGVEEWPPIL